ncbi:Target of rapamycin complex 1 subunit kog1 [Mycoemilia scoparia]|uniref:Target of rapamycin complex 1 subunit kog1 n=1 Tax=Mycoemilia scoparia TaxID=417184 RepID=A0A9W8A5F6_9FUNG|nr:Target of rapamycin complex 1 subunit kog1 [Mycoemilia scoparia]
MPATLSQSFSLKAHRADDSEPDDPPLSSVNDRASIVMRPRSKPNDIPEENLPEHIDSQRMPNHWTHRTDPFTYPRSMVISSLQLSIPLSVERTLTTDAILCLCLNIGVDPPGCVKPEKFAVLEAWVDPYKKNRKDATGMADVVLDYSVSRDAIMRSLQEQYTKMQKKLVVHTLVDPSTEAIQRKCSHLRRSGRGRILFHYNGHGVPTPTSNGDFWAFDEAFEQYVPCSPQFIYNALGSPTIYVWECANAEALMNAVKKVHAQRASEYQKQQESLKNEQHPMSGPPRSSGPNKRTILPYPEDIHFAATLLNGELPTNPELPADLFTSCLTNPIRMALRFWVCQNPSVAGVTMEEAEMLPGSTIDRRTPLGELNWIFVTITDSIAWSVLPQEMFYKLFRQDTIVASLFRNFLLADRIMRFYDCQPTCSPALPATHKHPMWEKWDTEVDICLKQLPKLLNAEKCRVRREKMRHRQEIRNDVERKRMMAYQRGNGRNKNLPVQMLIPGQLMTYVSHGLVSDDSDDEPSPKEFYDEDYQFKHSMYFSNQLRAFQVWLQHARMAVSQYLDSGDPNDKPRSLSLEAPPGLESSEELPVILQVVLSHSYRLRALALFYQFISLGPWAVEQASAIKITPYITKLLNSESLEIRNVLIMICARLVASDLMVLQSLGRNNYAYFISYLVSNLPINSQTEGHPRSQVRQMDTSQPQADFEAHSPDDNGTSGYNDKLVYTVCAASAFFLTVFCRNNPAAQAACFKFPCQVPGGTITLMDVYFEYLRDHEDETSERAQFNIWALLSMSKLWSTNLDIKWFAVTRKGSGLSNLTSVPGGSYGSREYSHPCMVLEILSNKLLNNNPHMRSAVLYAIRTLVSGLNQICTDPQHCEYVCLVRAQLYSCLLSATNDGSPMVRQELAISIGGAVYGEHPAAFIKAISLLIDGETGQPRRFTSSTSDLSFDLGPSSIYSEKHTKVLSETILDLTRTLLVLSEDPHPEVRRSAQRIVDTMLQAYLHSTYYYKQYHCLQNVFNQHVQQSSQRMGQQTSLPINQNLLPLVGGVSCTDNASINSQSANPLPTLRQSNSIGELEHNRPKTAVSSLQRSNTMTMGSKRTSSPLPVVWESHKSVGRSPSLPYSQEAPADSGASQHSVENKSNIDLKRQESEMARYIDERLKMIESAWLEWAQDELEGTMCQSYLIDWLGAQYAEINLGNSDPIVSNEKVVERAEKARRVQRVVNDVQKMSKRSTYLPWNEITTLGHRFPTTTSIHHPFESHLILAQKNGNIVTYDWDNKRVLSQFSSNLEGESSKYSTIRSLHLLNPNQQAILLVGCGDGTVKIFKDYYSTSSPLPVNSDKKGLDLAPDLMSAFRVLSEQQSNLDYSFPQLRSVSSMSSLGGPAGIMSRTPNAKRHSVGQSVVEPHLIAAQGTTSGSHKNSLNYTNHGTTRNSGRSAALSLSSTVPATRTADSGSLVLDWNQYNGYIYAGGSRSKLIKVWDIKSEQCVRELLPRFVDGINCMSVDQQMGNIIVAGSGLGHLRVFDCRKPDRTNCIQSWREHEGSQIVGCHMKPGLTEVISASSSGEIKIWDFRHNKSVFTIDSATTGQNITHFSVHQQIPVMASVSDTAVKVWNSRGSNIGTIPNTAFLHGATSPTYSTFSRVTLHPYLPVATLGWNNGSMINIEPRTSGPRSSS